MTQEEKAKLYDELKVKAQELTEDGYIDKLALVDMFPELKESEDERIRKALMQNLKERFGTKGNMGEGLDMPDVLAWLENQGEEKPNYCHHEVDLSECSEEYRKAYYDGWNNCNMQHSQCKSELDDVVKCLINGMKFYYEDNKEATWGTDKWSMPVKHIIEVLEKQGEQKPVVDTKVIIPKFRVGDIVKSKSQPMLSPRKIISIGKDCYWCEDRGCIGFAWEDDCEIVEQKPTDKVEPKFKVGDIIKPKCYNETHSIKAIGEHYYVLDVDIKIPFRDEDDWELVEQKPADEVEPKFKAGDWVVYKGDICQIVKREEDCNKLVTVFGTEKEPVNERNLSTARLWNIKDAKDGDVLADKFGVILFRKIGNEKYADAVDYYCAGFETGGFIIQKGVSYWGLSKEEELRPTTLEQRVRFFDTMGNAGYAWDAEKKELKKIEQKPQSTWKPSDEQMKALDFYIKTYVDTEGCYGSEVLELYEQLNKLKEE